ncbi:branched-chain amino acid ABC transporter permease [Natronobacterium texcoconense]|uniref:Amino acid/amide ABC transporter membrane protein 1, HAAT family n=1 Tax=Natronobacterium texcoconense TaxID=1095778 RepID=A0A1H1BTE5_NATTX|nr:branched-chain amino acid ABC transporter permease [Natronobacterium texcoconense]SDQ55222.1 amino acid/amide ABC transporter membrane protein 1, HAAT family [Natronobacterium texcoconense]
MLDAFLTVLVTGAIISALYALIAIGFTMIFGVGGVLNLAHGALIMAGSYLFLFVQRDVYLEAVAVNSLVALPATVLGIAVASYLLYVLLVRYIEENVVITFLATVVVATAFTEIMIWGIGQTPERFTIITSDPSLGPLTLPGSGVSVLGTFVSYTELAAFAVSWIAIGLLWYYVTKTDSGRAILATSMSERGAQLTGVDVHKVRARTWFIAGALAAVAGVFLVGTDTYALTPLMWLDPLALAFIIVVIGGIGSIKGSILAAYLIGYLETLVVYGPEFGLPVLDLLGSSFRGIFALIVLVVVLLVLPEGIYGREFVHE